MSILIKAGETTAEDKRVYFQCVDATDGIAAETGEAGGQPQISTNGAAFTNTGIGVLVAIGSGRYYAVLTDGAVDTTSRVIESHYKSANTAEAIGTTIQVVAFDPHAATDLGLSTLASAAQEGADGDTLETLSDQLDGVATAGALEEHHHHNWTVLLVQTGASGNADGTTWTDAYTTIQAALDAASDKSTIYVGAGTYAEAITVANNKIELKAFDFDTPFNHSTGTVRITGAANNPTCTITGDEVEVIGLDFTDHATGSRDGIYLNGADDCKITKCTIEGINSQLRDGIRILGNSRETAIFGCHIFGAEGSGINVTAAETHFHVEHTEVRVETGATAAINFSGGVTEADIDDCDLFAEGTVAAGILFGASTVNCAATMVRCHNFTTPYTDNGTTNSFIDVYDVIAPADAAYYTAARGPYLDELSSGNLPSDIDNVVARIGALTGTGDNTLLGLFKALLSKAAATPSDVGGTFSPAADSTEAIQELIAALNNLAAGAEMDLVDAPNATAITAIQSGLSTLAAGAEMDLVDAPNATAITAIQSGLAVEATLTAIKGAGWSDETLVAVKAVLDTAAADVVNIDGVAMRGTNSAYTGTPPTTAAIATAVWAETTRTLTSLGAGVIASVWNALTSGLTTVGSIGKLLVDNVDAKISDVTAPTVGEIDTELTAEHGSGSWQSEAGGTGANAVTLTLNDGDGNAVPNIGCVTRNSAESAVLATGTTDENGQCEFQLDDGSYKTRYGSSGSYTFSNPYTLTVSGATTQTDACAAVVIPASDDPTLCTCYIYLRYVESGTVVGAEEGYIQVTQVTSAGNIWPSVATTAATAVAGTKNYTDADGLASFDAIRGATLKVKVVRPWGTDYRAAEGTKEATIDVEVPDLASYAIQLSQN